MTRYDLCELDNGEIVVVRSNLTHDEAMAWITATGVPNNIFLQTTEDNNDQS